jgi:hypothetical protein
MRSRLRAYVLLLFVTAACQQLDPPDDFVARVGDAYLLKADIDARLAGLAIGPDTSNARQLIIDQWITDELLYQEALRLQLSTQENIKIRLNESTRAVLIEALISEYQDQDTSEVSQTEMVNYYERNKEYLRLLESFVHIRYLVNPSLDSLRLARRILLQTPDTNADSVFTVLIDRFDISPADQHALNQNYYPEAKLFNGQPEARALLQRTSEGMQPQIIGIDDNYHFLQVVDRVPAGTIPELSWVRDIVQQQLVIHIRKQNYARSVQALRAQAESSEDIEIR